MTDYRTIVEVIEQSGANLSGAAGRTDWDELVERGAIR